LGKNKLLITFVLIISFIFGVPSSQVYGQKKPALAKKPKVIISVSYIEDINFSVRVGEAFSPPATVTAEMSNKTTKEMPIKWTTVDIDTRNAGSYKYYGTVSGYSRKVKLLLTVEKLTYQDISKQSEKVILLKMYNEKKEEVALGSGFIVSPVGKVITNYHVIEYGKSIKAVLPNKKEYNVSGIINYSKELDIAVIQLETPDILEFVKTGDSDQLEVGEDIVAIGSPLGFQNTMSIGIVSSIRQDDYRKGCKDIQISAPISHGSSGGALFNMRGQVIGITYAGVDGGQNLNFAIPINDIDKLGFVHEGIDANSTFLSVYEKEHIIKHNNGDIYEGDLVGGIEDGNGVLTMVSGDKYEGQFVGGLYEGKGTYTWKSGENYTGDWKKGSKDGKGIYNYICGDRYEGDLKNDAKTGKGIYYWVNGNIYSGDFLNDKFNGKGTLYCINGDKYIGDFVNDNKEGNGVLYFSNGSKYQGNFKNDEFDGNGVYTLVNGSVVEGKFKNGEIVDNGVVILTSGEKVAYRIEGNNVIYTDSNNNVVTVPINSEGNGTNTGNGNVASGNNTNTSTSTSTGTGTSTEKPCYVNPKDPISLKYIHHTGEKVVVKWGYLALTFDRNMANSPDVSKVVFESEAGEKVQVTAMQPGCTDKLCLIILFNGNLKPNTRYKVFIPKNTIFSEDGQCYPNDISYTFKTAE
jgi:S1-C subfamily serine protease